MIWAQRRSDLLKLRAGAALLVLAALAFEAPAAAQDAAQGIAGNPGAVDVEPGTGALGRLIGFGPEGGIRLGGVLVSNGNYLASGGNNPSMASFNNLFVTGLDVDLDKLVHIPGATVGSALLRFDGEPTNQHAGVVTGYNSLPGAPPLNRTELYELWWRQSLFADLSSCGSESLCRRTISTMSYVRFRYKILHSKFPRSAGSSTRRCL